MSRIAYVIDTNVLLHDPDAINKFKDSDIIIPLFVLEELDNLKRSTDERGRNARHVIRFIDSLKGKGDLSKGVGLKTGSTLCIRSGRGPQKGFPLPLERSNLKLQVAFQEQEKHEKVVFLSKDLVMRVKAESIGLSSEDYQSLKFSYDNLYRGYRSLELPKDKIDAFYKDGFLSFEEEARANEYFFMTSPEKTSAVAKYNGERKRLEPLMKLSHFTS